MPMRGSFAADAKALLSELRADTADLGETFCESEFARAVRDAFDDQLISCISEPVQKELRESGLPIQQVAELAGVDAATVSRFERGAVPTIRTFLLLAIAFHVDVPNPVSCIPCACRGAFDVIERRLGKIGRESHRSKITDDEVFCLIFLVRNDDWDISRRALRQREGNARLAARCLRISRKDREGNEIQWLASQATAIVRLGEIRQLAHEALLAAELEAERRKQVDTQRGRMTPGRNDPWLERLRDFRIRAARHLSTAHQHIQEAVGLLADAEPPDGASAADAAEQCDIASSELENAITQSAEAALMGVNDRFVEFLQQETPPFDSVTELEAVFARHQETWLLLDYVHGFPSFD